MNVVKTIGHRFLHGIVFGAIYFVLESLWKGHPTDWRMFVLSALIGLMMGLINDVFPRDTDLRLQCFVGLMIALLAECICGYQWNIIEGLGLWNYSNPPLSYLSAVGGQINIIFAAMWYGLSFVCILLDDCMCYYLGHHGERPYYKVGDKIWLLLPKRNS